MTPTERKKKQYQLEALHIRKAKADALGTAAIAINQDLYDCICEEIMYLEQELNADIYDPLGELTELMLEIGQWSWTSEEQWAACKRDRPDLSEAIDSIGKQLTDDYYANRIPEYRHLIQQYRKAWLALNRFMNEHF